MYLLDTDWVIQALALRQPAARLLHNLEGSVMYISHTSVSELYDGAFTSSNPDAQLTIFRQFLSGYRFLGLDDSLMERFAETRIFLRRRGQSIADVDLLIASTVLHHDLTLLTVNVRHFERVPGLRLCQPS